MQKYKNYLISYYWRDKYGDGGFGDCEIEAEKLIREDIRKIILEEEKFDDLTILFIKEIDDGSVN